MLTTQDDNLEIETGLNSDISFAVGTLQNMKKKRKHADTLTREIFPLKLFQLLNEEKQENIVKWMGNGEYFKVFDKKRFLTDITPKYFRRKLYIFKLNIFTFVITDCFR